MHEPWKTTVIWVLLGLSSEAVSECAAHMITDTHPHKLLLYHRKFIVGFHIWKPALVLFSKYTLFWAPEGVHLFRLCGSGSSILESC